jgi:hypothetical protein
MWNLISHPIHPIHFSEASTATGLINKIKRVVGETANYGTTLEPLMALNFLDLSLSFLG